MRILIIAIFMGAFITAPAFSADKDEGFRFRQDPQVKASKPVKPIRIKLERAKDGKYTWEISGGSVEDVLKADEELKQRLGVK